LTLKNKKMDNSTLKFIFGIIALVVSSTFGKMLSNMIDQAIPNMPLFIIFLIGPVLVVALLYFWVQKFINSESLLKLPEDKKPFLYHARGIIAVGAFVGSLFGGYWACTPSRVSIYFDNGSKQSVMLRYWERGTPIDVRIAAEYAREVLMINGKQKIEINGKQKILNIVLTEKQLYNIDTLNIGCTKLVEESPPPFSITPK
jgi:hypothetical protein